MPREGNRKRTFSLPNDLDLALRRRAIDDGKEFSQVVKAALYQYLGIKPEREEIKRSRADSQVKRLKKINK